MSLRKSSKGDSPRRRQVERAASKRRHRLVGIIAVALAGVLVVGGTAAFLVASTPSVTNTFMPATVKTDIIEDDFTGTVKKNVTIKNLKDPSTNIPAYIRVKVVVNWAKVDANGKVTNVYGTAPVLGVDCTDWTIGAAAAGWVKHGDYYYWTSPVNPDASTGVLIDEIRVLKEPPSGYVLNVEILSEAIQAVGETSDGTPAVSHAWGVTIADGSVTAYQGSKA